MKKFSKLLDKVCCKSQEEMAEELGLSSDRDGLFIPYLMIFKCMAKYLGAKELWAPGSNISDGIACDLSLIHI